MRLLILSDLHLEFAAPQPFNVCRSCGDRYRKGEWNPKTPWFPGTCGVCHQETAITDPGTGGGLDNHWNLNMPHEDLYDAVVLAGDIHSHTHGITWAAREFSKPVFYVAGNHEYYGAHLGMVSELRKAASQTANVTFLENNCAIFGGVRFLGCTLWTNFELHGNSLKDITWAMHEAQRWMPDYGQIMASGGIHLRPTDTARMCRQSAVYLREQLQIPFGGKTVVITHHMPSMASVIDRFKKVTISAAFASDFVDILERVDGVWIHGHAHDSCEYEIDRCRVVCNPRGLLMNKMSGTYENIKFNPARIIEVCHGS